MLSDHAVLLDRIDPFIGRSSPTHEVATANRSHAKLARRFRRRVIPGQFFDLKRPVCVATVHPVPDHLRREALGRPGAAS